MVINDTSFVKIIIAKLDIERTNGWNRLENWVPLLEGGTTGMMDTEYRNTFLLAINS